MEQTGDDNRTDEDSRQVDKYRLRVDKHYVVLYRDGQSDSNPPESDSFPPENLVQSKTGWVTINTGNTPSTRRSLIGVLSSRINCRGANVLE